MLAALIAPLKIGTMIEFGHGTHAGLRRARNEDTYYADDAHGLFLVVDGMGGRRRGEAAAALTRDVVVELFLRGQQLADAIHYAHQRLHALVRDGGQPGLPMGSSLVALSLQGSAYEAAWVGGSRIYLWRQGLKRIDHDPALSGEAQAAAESRSLQRLDSGHPAPTQALGVTALGQLQIGMARGNCHPGSGFLLCSDGLSEELDDGAISRVLVRRELTAQECVEHLLLDALAAGGRDNMTAILARMN